jgi:hypothetical protein
MSDGVNIEELDYLTRQFYLGHDPDESEQAILDSIANEFINEDTPKSKYLITNNSAGYFRIDGTVKETNNEYYKLKLHVGATNMVDAASIAGCFLDENNGDDSQSDEIMVVQCHTQTRTQQSLLKANISKATKRMILKMTNIKMTRHYI